MKQYLRVSPKWTELLAPSDDPQYLANVSGTTIQIQFAKIRNLNIGADGNPSFALGGSIAQMLTPSGMYVYGKAINTSDSAILITDNARISQNDQTELQNALDKVTAEIMRATNRITTLESNDVDFGHKYYWLLRYFLNTTLKNQQFDAWLTERTTKLVKRIFAVEEWVLNHKKEFTSLQTVIGALDASGITADSIVSMKASLASVSGELSTVISRLNTLEPRVDDYTTDLMETIEKTVKPVTSKVDEVRNDFDALNNSLVVLVKQHTKQEVIDVAESLIDTYQETDPDMVSTVESLRDMIVSIYNKVDYGDVIKLGDAELDNILTK